MCKLFLYSFFPLATHCKSKWSQKNKNSISLNLPKCYIDLIGNQTTQQRRKFWNLVHCNVWVLSIIKCTIKAFVAMSIGLAMARLNPSTHKLVQVTSRVQARSSKSRARSSSWLMHRAHELKNFILLFNFFDFLFPFQNYLKFWST